LNTESHWTHRRSPRLVDQPRRHGDRVAFSADGSRIVSGSIDTTERVWDGDTEYPVLVTAFSPDGCNLASSSGDGNHPSMACRGEQ
jgi:WD40 repeat protein